MGAVYVDPVISEEKRRRLLYEGGLFVLSPGESSAGLAQLARDLSVEAFAPHNPEVAQETMPPEQYVEILADLKPRFIHHPRAKELIKGLLAESGADIDKTYFDVPRLRTMAHGEYLKAGLASSSTPTATRGSLRRMAQLNWWMPVYAIESDNSMAFHPRYFDEPIKNSSAELRLRTLEPDRAQAGGDDREEGDAEAADGRGAARARAVRAPRAASRRDDHLLGRPASLDGPEHDRPDALLDRLPHRQRRRPGERG